ncbi:hypothetical protein HMPREF1168_02987 [Aeromonas veronii AMC34]|uniref:Uncharacterized protein n=1 Tax=Aeromonas veronii AMC34 TaxID=1073383 RepID=K1IYP2_AERVE|nr:hypothetical protein HMPREF1168_02987 [Aeromonas veronii AMC34]
MATFLPSKGWLMLSAAQTITYDAALDVTATGGRNGQTGLAIPPISGCFVMPITRAVPLIPAYGVGLSRSSPLGIG